jgi:hypothetical protein
MSSSSLVPTCTRCRAGHVRSSIRPGRGRGPDVSGGPGRNGQGAQDGGHQVQHVRHVRDAGRSSPAPHSRRAYDSTAVARFGDGGAVVGSWLVSIMLCRWTSPPAQPATRGGRERHAALDVQRICRIAFSSPGGGFRSGKVRVPGQAVGRGARRWARCLSSSSSTSSSMGLPGAHIMVTTNSVVSSARALPSW